MRLVGNDLRGALTFEQALTELVRDAHTLSAAVSYVQVSGWHLFHRHIRELNLPGTRIVCTDQLAITPPAAVRLAQSFGVRIRNFEGSVTYHPKVFIAHDREGRATRFLLGSANLSHSAFTNSIEAGVLSAEDEALRALDAWFNDLFTRRSFEFDPATLETMEVKWRAAAASRARARLLVRRTVIPATPVPIELAAEDFDALDDVFATVTLPIGLLNMDYAGNNVRNVGRVREVLAAWSEVVVGTLPAHGKQRSELNLLGFADGINLTPLGLAASRATSDSEVALLWCRWLQNTSIAELSSVNAKLAVAKRVFKQFWQLKEPLRDFFLRHAESPSPSHRSTLQIIELLCNASDVVRDFSLEDVETLVPLLARPERLPDFVREAVMDYQNNKGTRGWDYPDRRLLPVAWRDALAET